MLLLFLWQNRISFHVFMLHHLCQVTQIVEIFHILQLFLFDRNFDGNGLLVPNIVRIRS